MAKLIAPPQINHLDELLDVLTNQDKYVGYMSDMQVMRDVIVEKLGLIDTQEKADQKLQEVQTKYAEALAIVREAQEEARDISAAIQLRQAAMDQREQAFAMNESQTRKQLEQDRLALVSQQVQLDKSTQEQDQRETRLRNWEDLLKSRAKGLDEKEAKLNKLKLAMGEAGI